MKSQNLVLFLVFYILTVERRVRPCTQSLYKINLNKFRICYSTVNEMVFLTGNPSSNNSSLAPTTAVGQLVGFYHSMYEYKLR
jgi:hypothetical protein